MPPACGPTRSRHSPSSVAGSGCAGLQGRARRRPAGPDRQRGRDHPAHREVGLFVIRGDALDHRDHRHRVESRPGASAATKADIDYILDHVNTVLATRLTTTTSTASTRVCSRCWPARASETQLSRRACGGLHYAGLVAIAGGKYTTYRVMAADAVDAAAEFIPTWWVPSITEKVPLIGADGYFALINQTEQVGVRHGLYPLPGTSSAGPVRLADRRRAGPGCR